MTHCPEPDLCKAGDQCAGRCRPQNIQVPDFDSFRHERLNSAPGKAVIERFAQGYAQPRSHYFQEQLDA